MSTPVYVDPESSAQADGAQSSQVPVTLPEDPYEAIRQAYLVGTDTESEPFEGEAEASESPHTVASPTSLPDCTPPAYHAEESKGSDTSGMRSTLLDSTIPLSPDHPLTHTTPTLVPILYRIARMVVRVPPTMSSGLSAIMAGVAAMSESTFRKRLRSSYKSLPSLSSLDLPLQKHYRGMFELVKDSEEDDDEEDEEIEESMDSDSVSEDAEDEGPTAKDEDPAAGDEGLAVGVEGPGMDDESHGLDDGSRRLDDEVHSVESDGLGLEEEEEAVHEGQQQVVPIVGIAGSGSVLEPERLERVSAFRQPTLTTWTDLEDGMVYIDVPVYPALAPPDLSPALFKRYDRDIGELFTRSGAVKDKIFSHRHRFRSLEYEQERAAVTFGAIWRPVLAMDSWACQTDAQRAALWHAISDMHRENQDLRLQLAEERRARLDLAEVVDGVRSRQEPRGDA
ncbi:hypothetical protein Tco_0086922 [Tanacetum coccineum]